MLVQMNMDFIFVPESAALRCLSFLDVKGTNFVPKKEICGGRKISKEQRYIISLGKKIFFEKYPFVHLNIILQTCSLYISQRRVRKRRW